MADDESELEGKILAVLDDLGRQIALAPEDEPSAAVLLCFTAKVREEFVRLTTPGVTLSARAWACRNLLELRTQVTYALSTPERMREFRDDVFVDGLQIFEAYRDLAEVLAGRLGETRQSMGIRLSQTDSNGAVLDKTIENLKRAKADEQITRTTYISTANMARLTGTAKEFEHVNRITSKLVHPTAFSVLVASGSLSLEFDGFKMLGHAGAAYAVEAVLKIRQYLNRLADEDANWIRK